MTDREKICARIRALLAKTVENGCTEDEALAAARKAAEMLARYNLTVDEVQMRASPFKHHRETHADEVGDRLWKVADGIAHLTGARYWANAPGCATEINFFGFDHEVLVARYLLEICACAMLQEHARLERKHRLLVAANRRRHVLPFLDCMADRLRQRIRDMKPPAPTGKGLIVLHRDLIDAAMADHGFKLNQGRARGSRDNEASYIDGLRAGDRVPLNQGLRGGAAMGLLTA